MSNSSGFSIACKGAAAVVGVLCLIAGIILAATLGFQAAIGSWVGGALTFLIFWGIAKILDEIGQLQTSVYALYQHMQNMHKEQMSAVEQESSAEGIWVCKSCGQKNKKGEAFCKGCGKYR